MILINNWIDKLVSFILKYEAKIVIFLNLQGFFEDFWFIAYKESHKKRRPEGLLLV